MSIFNLTDEKMKETSSTFTAHEIYQQPATWRKTCAQLAACKDELQAFIDQVVKQDDFDIVLTGAGTSEFVGNSLFQALNPKYDFKVKSYASTDLVPSPENFLSRTKPTLLVNFGRSGNSPESLGNVEAAEVVCQNLYHLFVTCNHEGTLSKMANTRHNCFAINLTPETHDQSFAMTSSYSNMYLAAYLAFNLDKLDEITAEVEKLAVAGQHFLDDQFGLAQKIVDEFDYNRIVYLGNIGLKGVAQESALKTLELTAGKVATMYDSELGFRHGPKSIIDDNTLTGSGQGDGTPAQGQQDRRRLQPRLRGHRGAGRLSRPDQGRCRHGERPAGSGLHPVRTDHRSDEVPVSGHHPG